jgi:hypothetical protein
MNAELKERLTMASNFFWLIEGEAHIKIPFYICQVRRQKQESLLFGDLHSFAHSFGMSVPDRPDAGWTQIRFEFQTFKVPIACFADSLVFISY